MALTMRIKKGDTVKIMAGAHKGKTGTVLRTIPKEQKVVIDGIGLVKRHIRPNQLNPRGGTKDIHVAFPVAKVALVTDGKEATSRVAYRTNKEGVKSRVATQQKNKEIK